MSPSARRHRTLRGALLFTVALGAVSGCSATAAGSSRPAADQSQPGPVALAYTQALFTGGTAAALPFVLPADRGNLSAVPLPKNLNVRSYGLQVGSASVHDTSATVVLTGKICNLTTPSGGTVPETAAPAGSCISNDDQNSTNPLFRVSLVRAADQKWYVGFTGIPSQQASARAGH